MQRLERFWKPGTAMDTLARFGQTSTTCCKRSYIQGSVRLPGRQTLTIVAIHQGDRDIAFALIDFAGLTLFQYLSFWWERIFSRLGWHRSPDARFRQQRQWRMVPLYVADHKDVSQTSFAIMVDSGQPFLSSGTPIAFRASVSCVHQWR